MVPIHTVIKYDSDDLSNEAKATGPGPCIHYIGFAVDALGAHVRELEKRGHEMINDPRVEPVKVRVPGGTIAEFAPADRSKIG